MEKGGLFFMLNLRYLIVTGVFVYIFMIHLRQNKIVAENRGLLLSALMLLSVLIIAYMLLFGHGLQSSINKNLF
jgi:hypothetical protein